MAQSAKSTASQDAHAAWGNTTPFPLGAQLLGTSPGPGGMILARFQLGDMVYEGAEGVYWRVVSSSWSSTATVSQ